MDPSVQTPPTDPQQPQADSPTQTTNPEEQAAMQRGDIPMKVDDSIKATQVADSEALDKMNQVASAENINNQTTLNEVKSTDSTLTDDTQGVTDHGKSADQI